MQPPLENLKLLRLLLAVLSLSQSAFSLVVRNGDELVGKLCEAEMREALVITLESSFNYSIQGNHSCVVNVHSVEIASSDQVEVICVNRSVSFAFIDTAVSMSNVTFSGCGSFLSRLDTNLLNSTSLRFLGTHSGLFVFLNSSAKFVDVNINYYVGFAILGINMERSHFIRLSVVGNIGIVYEQKYGHMVGSGMLLLFTNSIGYSPIRPHVAIVNSTFFANYELISQDGKGCVISHFRTLLKPFIINAGALTVIFNVDSPVHQIPSVSIKGSLFKHNTGSYAGGLLIIMLNSTTGQVRIAEKTSFQNNNNLFKCPGSALVFYAVGAQHGLIDSLIVSGTNFLEHNGFIHDDDINTKRKKTGTVFIGIYNSRAQYAFLFENVEFSKNEADVFGTCLSVIVYDGGESAKEVRVKVTLRSVVANENIYSKKNVVVSGGGSFIFNSVDDVVIEGTAHSPSQFSSNQGSVIHVHNTPIKLLGVIKFRDNMAVEGAVLLMRDSLLYFNDGLELEVVNNSADTLGGAIHIISVNSYTIDLPNCALQISKNVTCSFSDNKAVLSGNSIFAFPIYSCYNMETSEIISSRSYYTNIFDFSANHSSSLNDVSTNAHQIIILNYYATENYFPGQKISLHVCASDSDNDSCVYSVIRVSLTLFGSSVYSPSHSTILDSEKVQYLNESNDFTYSIVDVTVFYHDDHNKASETTLKIMLSSHSQVAFFDLEIHEDICPPGFNFHNGICMCGKAATQFYKAVYFPEETQFCNINSLSFKKPSYIASPWLGYIDIKGKKMFGITDLCPFDICSANFEMSEMQYDVKRDLFLLSNGAKNVSVCREHREGTLCGRCSSGYSIVFGSGKCMKCSNWWLWTILLYAIAGPLLIYILYALNLTLTTGTINGIIFYSQAANVGILPFVNFFPKSYYFLNLVYFFLSSLNLNLGFSLCFYDGMNEVTKTSLTLIFPIYLLSIIIIIIVASQYSTWISNKTSTTSVQVLVTVVHISVSKLLVTIIEVFTPTVVYTDEAHARKVWFRDGNIEFFDSSKWSVMLLMVFTVATVSFVMLPYFTLLIGGRCLLRYSVFNKYCRAVYEAINGAYKENRRFWFLVRQILLIAMFIIYSAFRGKAIHLVVILSLTLLILFLVAQEYLKPYKNKAIGILDSSIMLNLIGIYLIACFQASGYTAPHLSFLVILVCILVGIVFITFLSVLTYHILLIWRLSNCYPFRKVSRTSDESVLALSNASQMSFYSSCSKYREPVINYK